MLFILVACSPRISPSLNVGWVDWVDRTNELSYQSLLEFKIDGRNDVQRFNYQGCLLSLAGYKRMLISFYSFLFPFILITSSERRWQVRELWFFRCAIWHSLATMMKENDGRLLFNYSELHWWTRDYCLKRRRNDSLLYFILEDYVFLNYFLFEL